MIQLVKRASAGAVAWLACAATQAGPMGFKDSTMAMGDFGPNWQEAWVNHAVTPRDALGVGQVWMRSDDGQRTRSLAEVTYTRLVKRWNAEHSQANFWFVGGLGSVGGNDFADYRTLLAPGVALDFETTRVYLSATARLYRAEGLNHDYASVRTGFSFYEAEYDEVQPWLILEARRMNQLSNSLEVTPMLRFIHKRYFVEIGVSTSNQPRFNFMYIF